MAEVYWIHLAEHTDMFSQGYIGFTSTTASRRFAGHKFDTKRHGGLPIHHAIRKYGKLLIVQTICKCSNEYGLWLEKELRPACKIGWNVAIGGESPSFGMEVSDETRKKMSLAATGRPCSEETRKKLSDSNRGKKRSEETKEKLRKIANNRSEEWLLKLKMSKQNISDEARKNVSEAQKGKVRSNESIEKQKMSYRANNHHPWEHHSATKEIWLLADKIFLAIEPLGFVQASAAIAEKVGFYDKSRMGNMIKKFKRGWNPLNDEDYLIWKEDTLRES